MHALKTIIQSNSISMCLDCIYIQCDYINIYAYMYVYVHTQWLRPCYAHVTMHHMHHVCTLYDTLYSFDYFLTVK